MSLFLNKILGVKLVKHQLLKIYGHVSFLRTCETNI